MGSDPKKTITAHLYDKEGRPIRTPAGHLLDVGDTITHSICLVRRTGIVFVIQVPGSGVNQPYVMRDLPNIHS